MRDLDDLIARLEAASEGSRDLDQDIEIAINPPREDVYRCPHYTTSLDAALRLMPAGWLWDVASTGCVWVMPNDDLDKQIVISGIEKPVIALCIAALKARER